MLFVPLLTVCITQCKQWRGLWEVSQTSAAVISVARSLTQKQHNSRLKTAQKPPKNFPENRPKKPTIFGTYFAV